MALLGPFQYQPYSLYDVDISSSSLEEVLYQKCCIPLGTTIFDYVNFNLGRVWSTHSSIPMNIKIGILKNSKSAWLVAKLFFLPQAKISRFLLRGKDCSGYKILEIIMCLYIFNFPFIHLNVKEKEGFQMNNLLHWYSVVEGFFCFLFFCNVFLLKFPI